MPASTPIQHTADQAEIASSKADLAAKNGKKTKDQPHDSLFKELMEYEAVARSFLAAWLPQDLSDACDFATIESLPTAFVARQRASICDILLSIKARYFYERLYVFTEHQSTPDKNMRLRLKNYQARIAERYCENADDAPLVVPILLYHGEIRPYPWAVTMRQKATGAFSRYKKQVRSDFVPILADLTAVSDEELMTHGQAAFMEIALKHTCHQSRRMARAEVIARSGQFLAGMQLLKNRYGKECLALHSRCMDYWFKNNKIPPDLSIDEIVQHLPENIRGDIMSQLDTLEQRSWNGGIQLGEQRGMQIGEQRGIQIGEQRGMQIGEQRGMQLGEQRGIQIGEQRGMQLGEQRGMQIGEQIGRQESQQEIAQRMLQMGWEYADIMAVTGIREDQLKKID